MADLCILSLSTCALTALLIADAGHLSLSTCDSVFDRWCSQLISVLECFRSYSVDRESDCGVHSAISTALPLGPDALTGLPEFRWPMVSGTRGGRL